MVVTVERQLIIYYNNSYHVCFDALTTTLRMETTIYTCTRNNHLGVSVKANYEYNSIACYY